MMLFPRTIEDIHLKSDEEILELSTDHPYVFEEIVNRYQRPFIRKAQKVLRNKEEAEDAVQDTFTKIYLHSEKFQVQDGATFKSWAYKILLNTCFSRYQKQKREGEIVVRVDTEMYVALPDHTSRQFEKDITEDLVVSLLSRLPRVFAKTLELHYLKGYSQKEIAEMQGVSVSAVKTRVHRAKKVLKKINAGFVGLF